MRLLRKYKISLITGIPLTGVDKEIIDFIQDKLSGLVRFEHENYPGSILYMKDRVVVLEQNSMTEILSCKYSHIWEELEEKYDMKYEDVQYIIKYLVEVTLKIKVGTPHYN